MSALNRFSLKNVPSFTGFGTGPLGACLRECKLGTNNIVGPVCENKVEDAVIPCRFVNNLGEKVLSHTI